MAGGRKTHRSELAADLGAHPREVADLSTADQDLLLLTVPDGAIAAVAAELAARPQATVCLHVAGALGPSALAALAENGHSVGGLHPLKAFPRSLPEPSEAHGVVFAIDGDEAAARLATEIARSWGGVPVEVPESARTLYHFGATLAAGGVVTLLATAGEIASAAGLGPEIAEGYRRLAIGALDGVRGNIAAAITGPVARGDIGTTRRQLEALDAVTPALGETARSMIRESRRQLARAGRGLPDEADWAALLDRDGRTPRT